LEPDQLHGTRVVSEVADKSLPTALPHFLDRYQASNNLRRCHIGVDLLDFMELGEVDITERVMFEQVAKCVDTQLILEYLGTGGAYAFEVFNGGYGAECCHGKFVLSTVHANLGKTFRSALQLNRNTAK